ncbi:hypothetical protein Tco_1547566 [Tanacetum coccineum]
MMCVLAHISGKKKKASEAGKTKQPTPAKQPKPSKKTTSKPTPSKKVRKGKRSDNLVDKVDEESQPATEPQVEDDEYNLQRGIQMSLESFQEPIGGVAICEPDSGIIRKLPEFEGKGKGIVSKEQATQSLLDLQNPKKKGIMDQYIFQMQTLATEDASTGPSVQPQDDTSVNVVYDTSSLIDSTNDDDNVADMELFTSKVDTEILNVDEEHGEEVSHTLAIKERTVEIDEGQAGPNPEPMHEDFIATVYPAVHENLKLTTEEQVHIENPPSSSGTLSSMKNLENPTSPHRSHTSQTSITSRSRTNLYSNNCNKNNTAATTTTSTITKHNRSSQSCHCTGPKTKKRSADFEQKHQLQDKTTNKLEHHYLYSKINKHVNEVVKEAVHNALQTPLHERFRDVSEVQMKEILHDWMFETLASHKRRCDDQDPPPPPPKNSERSKKKRQDSDASASKQPPVQKDGNGSGNFGDRIYHPHPRFCLIPIPIWESIYIPIPFGVGVGVGYGAGDLCYSHPRPIPGFIIRGFPVPIPIPGQLGDSPVNSGLGIGSPSGTGFIAIPTASPSEQPVDDNPIPEDMHLSKSKDINASHLLKIKSRPDWLKPVPEEDIPETPEPDWVIPPNDLPKTENNWADALAKTYKDPEEYKLLQKIRDTGSFIKCAGGWGGGEGVVRALLLTDQIDLMNPEGNRVVHDINKPLPLGGPLGQVTIQPQYFFNKDLEYLVLGNKEGRHALSISKLKVAYYPDFGLEELVRYLWTESEIAYDISSAYGISHWWFKRKEFYITSHSAPSDHNAVRSHMRILSIILEADFKNLHPSNFEDLYLLNLLGKLNYLFGADKVHLSTTVNLWNRNIVIRQCVEDLQLGIKSYQTKLNITQPSWDATDFLFKEDYTIIHKLRAIIYRDRNDQKKMMRESKVHNFSDGTLMRILEKLDYMVKDYELFKFNLGMERRIWTKDDKWRSQEFIKLIKRRLKIRRIFKSLESFVSGRLSDIDYRLINRT